MVYRTKQIEKKMKSQKNWKYFVERAMKRSKNSLNSFLIAVIGFWEQTSQAMILTEFSFFKDEIDSSRLKQAFLQKKSIKI